MEHYKQGETIEVGITDLPPNVETAENSEVIQMRVLYGSKIWNLMGFALKKIKEEQVRKVVWNGCGHSVTKAVTCAEIMKRKVKNLHQNTQIYYKRVEDIWEPKLEELDRLKVNRDIPAISITLSKDQLEKDIPGYQAPNSTDGLWTVQSQGKNESAGKNRKQSEAKSTGQHQKKSSQKQKQCGTYRDSNHDNRNKKEKERDGANEAREGRGTVKDDSGQTQDCKEQKSVGSRQQIGRRYQGGRGRGYHHGYRGLGSSRGHRSLENMDRRENETKKDQSKE